MSHACYKPSQHFSHNFRIGLIWAPLQILIMAKKPAEISEFPRKIILMLIALAFLIIFGTVSFSVIKGISLSEALLRTMESLAFMFQEESGPGKMLEMFLSLFGILTVWWVFWNIFDMLLEGNLKEYLRLKRFINKVKVMKDHYIIAGGGRVGEEIAKNLSKDGKEYIIIEKDEAAVAKLKKKDMVVIHGDAHDESILKQAGISKARAMIITLPDVEKALVATMIAKEMNSGIDIFARSENPNFINKLKKAGAKSVVVPEVVAAEKFMEEIKKP